MVALVALIVLSALALGAFRLLRRGSLPGIQVAGADMGGMSEDDLRDALREVMGERRDDRLVFRRPATSIAREETEVTTGGDLGYFIDIGATVERVMERGRQGNPVAALVDHLVGTFGTIEVRPQDSFVVDADDSVTAALAESVSSPPFYGGVGFDVRDGREVEPRYPDAGVLVSQEELVRKGLRAVRDPGDDVVVLEGDPVDPATDRADVDALVAEAERAIDGPVELRRGSASVTFSPREIAAAIVTKHDEDSLSLAIPFRKIEAAIEAKESELETPPVDATFTTSGDSVKIVDDVPGFKLVPRRTAEQLLEVALEKGAGKAKLEGETAQAEFTTADAKALDIEERVSTFTTYHSCCEPRVANIHRIADIVDGAVVEEGESFSLNEFVGPRTTSNGFVAAPAIRDGEFVEEVGGGISQFATTFFNAIFYGGYDFLEYQPHSYYISRYPPGREATISTPGPDLEFLNDSDSGIYIDTSYSETSITVSFYGSQDFDVDAIEGPRKNVTEPKEECRENESLAAGEESVVQEGLTGFDIVVTRVFGDGRPDEHFSTHYDMQPRIVERRRCPDGKDRGRKRS